MNSTTANSEATMPNILPALPSANDRDFVRAGNLALVAAEYQIDSQDMYELAAAELVTLETTRKDLDARLKSLTDPANQIIANARALFKPAQDKLTAASATLRNLMLEWTRKEQARIANENAERERVAREAREAMNRQADEAEAKGHAEDAFAMRETAALMPSVHVSTAAPRAAGVSMRSNWTAECLDLSKLVAFVAANPEHLHLLKANDTALRQMAKAQKGRMNVPGVRAWDDAGMTVRTKK